MKKPYVFIFLVIAVFSALFVWWNNGAAPVKKQDKNGVIFVVEKGQGVREIANRLKKENLIRDPIVFFLVVKKEGLDGKIQAGDFRLTRDMSAAQIAENLTHGTLDIWVTVPEGKRADEIADLLSEKIPSYQPQWRETLDENEGYLFPDTYLIPKDATVETVIFVMTNNFEKKFQEVDSSSLSKNEIVTIASLIEREAKHPQDRPFVSSVIANRLEIGMKLDIDATVQYAVASRRCNPIADTVKCQWWPRNLTRDDLAINSFYNTYRNSGLPPTPISNPGLLSLKAAANPAKTNYLYYISDKNGINRYAETLEQHNSNIQKYGL